MQWRKQAEETENEQAATTTTKTSTPDFIGNRREPTPQVTKETARQQ
jgi:hypothetical protein